MRHVHLPRQKWVSDDDAHALLIFGDSLASQTQMPSEVTLQAWADVGVDDAPRFTTRVGMKPYFASFLPNGSRVALLGICDERTTVKTFIVRDDLANLTPHWHQAVGNTMATHECHKIVFGDSGNRVCAVQTSRLALYSRGLVSHFTPRDHVAAIAGVDKRARVQFIPDGILLSLPGHTLRIEYTDFTVDLEQVAPEA